MKSFLTYLFNTEFSEDTSSACKNVIKKLENIFKYLKNTPNFDFELFRKNLISVFYRQFDSWKILPDFLSLINFIIQLNIDLCLASGHTKCKSYYLIPDASVKFTRCLPCWLYNQLYKHKIRNHCDQRGYTKEILFYRA